MAATVAETEYPHLGGELDYPGGHALHTGWLIWHDKKPKGGGGGKDSVMPRMLGRFNTAETFWQYARRVHRCPSKALRATLSSCRLYTPLARPNCPARLPTQVPTAQSLPHSTSLHAVPSPRRHYVWLERDIGRDNTLHFFREMYPLRSEGYKGYPGAGCFLLKVHRTLEASALLWEKLLLATIGEAFEDLGIMGCSITVAAHQNLYYGLWFTNAKKDKARLERIRQRLREVLGLPELLAAQAVAQQAAQAAASEAKLNGFAGGNGGSTPAKPPMYSEIDYYDDSLPAATQHPSSLQLCRVLALDPQQVNGGGGSGGGSNGGGGGGGGGKGHGGHSGGNQHKKDGKGKGGNGGGGEKGEGQGGGGNHSRDNSGKAKGGSGGGGSGNGVGNGIGSGVDKEKGAAVKGSADKAEQKPVAAAATAAGATAAGDAKPEAGGGGKALEKRESGGPPKVEAVKADLPKSDAAKPEAAKPDVVNAANGGADVGPKAQPAE